MASCCSTQWTRITMLEVNNLIGFGAGGGAGWRKWRLLINSTSNTTYSWGIGTLKMRSTPGGSDLCQFYSGVISSFGSGNQSAPSVIFSGVDYVFPSTSTWGNNGNGAGWWVEYDFQTEVDIVELMLFRRAYTAYGNYITNCSLQYYDGAAWQTVQTWAITSNIQTLGV